MRFNVGVIGATGYIGTPYRREMRESPDVSIVALCARRRELLEAAQREDAAALITSDWREVVDHPDVNFVVVATPDALHIEPALACAKAGKHLLCEKPLGADAAQAGRIWSAYRDSPLGHFVPFWTRYAPLFVKAREVVRQGTLGAVQAVICRWHNPRPAAMPFTWRDDAALSSAGSVADVGSHAYDSLRWLLGQQATRVLAHAGVIAADKPDLGGINLEEALQWGDAHETGQAVKTRRGTAYDYADIAFELDGGAVGSLVLSHAPFLRKGLAPELELHGSESSLALDRVSGALTLARSGEEPQRLETIHEDRTRNRFANFVFPALRAQLAGKPTEHANLHDGWRAQLFTDAAALSAKRGAWVELAELEC